jgi:hypothetical protein
MSQFNKKNLEMLYANLRDLNDISREVTHDLRNKNEILKNGYKDCVECKAYIDRSTLNKKRKS